MKYDAKTPYEAYLVARIKEARREAQLELRELLAIVEDCVAGPVAPDDVASPVRALLVQLHENISVKIAARVLIDEDG